MFIGRFDTVSPEVMPRELPLRLEQRSSVTSSLLKLAVLVPAVVLMLVPFGMVAAQGIADSETRAAIAANPFSTLQLLAAMALWLGLFAWPLKGTVVALARSRLVEVAEGQVTVHDRGLGRSEVWQAPVASFSGLTHNVRTSVSGVRHEVVLTHHDAQRSVLIAVAPRIGDSEIAALAGLLGRPVLARRNAGDDPLATAGLELARA